MISHRYGKTLAVRLDEGEEVISSMSSALTRHKINTGVILTFIGALRGCRLILRKGYEKRVESHVEVVGNGNVSIYERKPFVHLHVSAGNDKGVWVGHLTEGTVDIFCEAMILPFTGKMVRKYDKALAESGVTVPYTLDLGR
jgi:predicted DNA-binding protein with PD1-like motif